MGTLGSHTAPGRLDGSTHSGCHRLPRTGKGGSILRVDGTREGMGVGEAWRMHQCTVPRTLSFDARDRPTPPRPRTGAAIVSKPRDKTEATQLAWEAHVGRRAAITSPSELLSDWWAQLVKGRS